MSRRIQCGINIDPMNVNGDPSAQEIQELGATWVRFTFQDRGSGPAPTSFPIYDRKVQELEQAGINTLMILDYGTYPGKPAYEAEDSVWEAYIESFAARCGQVASHYGDRVQAYQIWNEPDLPHAQPSYNPRVREQILGPMLKAAFEAIKEASTATVVMGGLASGDPSYVARVQAATAENVLYADAVGVHPYGQRPTSTWPSSTWGFGVLGHLIRRYHNVARKPIWITEYGVEAAAVQGEFPRRAFEAVNESLYQEAPCLFWFCWSDGMVSPYGLVQASQQRKPAYFGYQSFARLPAVEESPGGAPVVNYHSHYVVFPAGAGWNWYHASRHYLQHYRVTRGESLDDAAKVHGTLGHTITCINPTPEAIRYLQRVNPHAQLDLIYVDNVDELEAEMDRRVENDLRFGA
jgi:hypothetical protein